MSKVHAHIMIGMIGAMLVIQAWAMVIRPEMIANDLSKGMSEATARAACEADHGELYCNANNTWKRYQ